MQCKDIPDESILELMEPGCMYSYGHFDSLGLPYKLLRAKMAVLIRKGLITGCTCGCRGDFEISPTQEKPGS